MNIASFANKIRRHAIMMTSSGNSSHIGSVLSIADILAVLYGQVMNVDPANPVWDERDRFILSKGHAGAGVYAALAIKGFFDESDLRQHYQDGSLLSGHVSHKNIPGVEFSTGSLGHGLPVGAGMAYAAKRAQAKHRVYVLLSDGECDEGSNWESILFAAHHKLDNLVAIIDYNKLQSLDTTEKTLALEPFADKWRAFNWNVQEVCGHDHEELSRVLGSAKSHRNQPNCIIAHTTKGKGVEFMENEVLWHYKSPQKDDYIKALEMLEVTV